MQNKKFKGTIVSPLQLVLIFAVASLVVMNFQLRKELVKIRQEKAEAASLAIDMKVAALNAENAVKIQQDAVKKAAEAAIAAAAEQTPLIPVAVEWSDIKQSVEISFNTGSWFIPGEEGTFDFSPPVEKVNWWNSYYGDNDTVEIRGEFQPDTLYTMTLRKGWRTSDGKYMLKPHKLSFKTGKARPSFELRAHQGYYPASRKMLRLPFTAGGVTNLHVKVGRVYNNDIPLYGMDYWSQEDNTHIVADTDIAIMQADCVRATRKDGFIDLGAILGEPEPGIYFVGVEPSPRGWTGNTTTMIALTDMAIQYAGPTESERGCAAVFVTGFGDGEPVEGVEVSVMTKKHQLAGKGKTDAQGLALVELTQDDGDSISLVTATRGNDVSALNLNDSANLVSHAQDNPKEECGNPLAFVFSERELCRPGEKFQSAIFARTALTSGAEVLSEAPAELMLIDPSGEIASRQRVTTDGMGFASADWTIPQSAALGTWRVECNIAGRIAGTLYMRVATYRPDRIKMELAPEAHEIVGLDTRLKIAGSARYYFGEPLSGGNCRAAVAAVGEAKKPKSWEGWNIGVEGVKVNDWKLPVELKQDGTFEFTYPGLAENGASEIYTPVKLAIVVTAQEPGGAGVAQGDTVTVHPTSSYIGIREANEEASAFDFAVFPALESAAEPSKEKMEIDISVTQHKWERHLEKNGMGSLVVKWIEKSEKVDTLSRKLTVPAGESLSWTGRVDYTECHLEDGRYTMEAVCGDAMKTSFTFWHWAGEGSDRPSSPNSFMIELGAPKYAPGDIAVLKFRSPFEGLACISAGAIGVETAYSTKVVPGMNSLQVKIPETLLQARYHASVTLVAGDGNQTPRLSSVAAIPVDNSGNRKLVASLVLPECARPNGVTRIGVELHDTAGNPASGLVWLAALDEGVASLTNFHVEDAYGYFFKRKYGKPFPNYDCFGSILPDLRIMPDGTFGGDAAVMAANKYASLIKEKETLRFVLPVVHVDESGKAEVEMTMPDHLGALRVMAVAASKSCAGSCEETLVVRNAISILPGAPRFAAPGDIFTLTAQIFNHDAAEGDWHLKTRLPSGLSAMGGEDSTTIERRGRLAPGANEIVEFEIEIPKDAAGAQEISFELSLGDEKATGSVTVNVRTSRSAMTKVQFLTAIDAPITISADATNWLGEAQSKVMLHASPAYAVADSLSWLSAYPYGCAEQTVSRAFPLLAAADMEKIGIIDSDTRKSAESKIKLAYAEILGMRFPDGGFGMWPWSKDTWRYGSLFANHFIFEARRAGVIAPPKELVEIQKRWLRNIAADASANNRDDAAYAAYILSVCEDYSFAASARNIIEADGNDFAAFLAAAALIRAGFASEGAPVFTRLVATRVWETEHGYDAIRRAGLALFAACKTGYGDIASFAPAALWLNGQLRSDGSSWGTTRDNAWAALGLASFASRLGSGFSTGVYRTDDGSAIPFDVSSAPASFERDISKAINIESDGPVMVAVTTTGIPAEAPVDLGPIAISRRYVDARGKAVTTVKRGDLVTAIVTIRSPRAIENAVIADMIPGGFEIEDASFATRSTIGAYALPALTPSPVGFSEARNDRWLWFGNVAATRQGELPQTLIYHLRAVNNGTFAATETTIEAMYDVSLFGRAISEGKIKVESE